MRPLTRPVIGAQPILEISILGIPGIAIRVLPEHLSPGNIALRERGALVPAVYFGRVLRGFRGFVFENGVGRPDPP